MIYLFIASCLWALSFSLIKGQLSGLDPSTVSAIRMVIALLVFLPFLRVQPIRWAHRIELCCLGAIQYGFMYLLYIQSYAYLSAAEVALLTATTPLLVIIFQNGFNRSYPKVVWLAALLSVLGGIVIVYQADSSLQTLTGVLLLQAANACFAIGQVWYKHRHERWGQSDQKRSFALLYLGATLLTVLFSVSSGSLFRFHATDHQWLVLFYLGAIPSGLCFFLWNLGATKSHVGQLAVMNNCKAPLGVLFALLFLHEDHALGPLIFGSVLIGGGLIIAERLKINVS